MMNDPTDPNDRPHDEDPQADTITEERAARRYHQIRHMEKQIAALDVKISNAKDKLTLLKEQREAQIVKLFEAVRDEGALPLFEDL